MRYGSTGHAAVAVRTSVHNAGQLSANRPTITWPTQIEKEQRRHRRGPQSIVAIVLAVSTVLNRQWRSNHCSGIFHCRRGARARWSITTVERRRRDARPGVLSGPSRATSWKTYVAVNSSWRSRRCSGTASREGEPGTLKITTVDGETAIATTVATPVSRATSTTYVAGDNWPRRLVSARQGSHHREDRARRLDFRLSGWMPVESGENQRSRSQRQSRGNRFPASWPGFAPFDHFVNNRPRSLVLPRTDMFHERASSAGE